MAEKIILQLELKDIFFHKIKVKPSAKEYVELDGCFYVPRKHLRDFIQTLSFHFDFSIWSVYAENECKFFADYLSSLGAKLRYYRNDCYTFPLENGEWAAGKRLKRLSITNIKIDRLICIESNVPIRDNYNNYFLIPKFDGDEDDVLLNSALELVELKDVENTTRINYF